MRDFESRHWQARNVFLRRFDEICALLDLELGDLDDKRKQLVGAYFCHEYSYAAAALMNPSIVAHPDQSGLDKKTVRIVMSLRAVGEGHISSVAFREGLVSEGGGFELAPEPPFATATDAPDVDGLFEDGPITVFRDENTNLSGTVIFPITPKQAGGLEDLRLTHFTHQDGSQEYIGTYTAYSGRDIRSELLRTCDFRSFNLCPIAGDAARNKGMALFPRKIGGRYMMVGRQDGQNLFLLSSDDLHAWNGGDLLMRPQYPWELIQIGNCGAPIEIDEGWLLLTHGVGAMRQYAIGAVLLDRDDPSKILGRTRQPILQAENDDRNGYVPNVVYTCGGMRCGDQLFMPYGISDSSVGFAFMSLKKLLAAMD
ncbi:MAG: glycoside hydrolase family 130 protein, partial [Pseudomonadota bacterium]|nr:glycoside hydrolase family 130 protein [Pseudomonadota bacterium]